MKKYLIQGLLLLIVFVYAGCSGKDILIVDYTKNNKIVKSFYQANTINSPKIECKTCKKSTNAKYKCSMSTMLNTISKETIKRGYSFFTITPKWKDDPVSFNNTPINSLKKTNRYCNEVYYDEDSDLEDDKCHPIGFGEGYPYKFNVEVSYYKGRNPIFPVWDAKKTLEETKESLNDCLASRDGKPLVIEYEKEELED